MARPLHSSPGVALAFHAPYIAGRRLDPGRQPYAPGESQADSNPSFQAIPWPSVVPSLVALASNPGTPQARPVAVDNNATAPGLSNYLYLSGVVGKSRG